MIKKLYHLFFAEITKYIILLLGFSLATMRCLAQYMAPTDFMPSAKITLHFNEVKHAKKHTFKAVVNTKDTIVLDAKNNYEQSITNWDDTLDIRVFEHTTNTQNTYIPTHFLYVNKNKRRQNIDIYMRKNDED